jgi:hypothetical protein
MAREINLQKVHFRTMKKVTFNNYQEAYRGGQDCVEERAGGRGGVGAEAAGQGADGADGALPRVDVHLHRGGEQEERGGHLEGDGSRWMFTLLQLTTMMAVNVRTAEPSGKVMDWMRGRKARGPPCLSSMASTLLSWS